MAIAQDLANLASAFAFEGEPTKAQAIASGHINRTYYLTYDNGRGGENYYLLQKINSAVFQDVPALMANVARLLAYFKNEPHISEELFYGREPELIFTKNGASFLAAADGSFWRAYTFIGAATILKEPALVEIRAAAFAYGSLARRLANLSCELFNETIPNFHALKSRLLAFNAALSAAAEERPERYKKVLPLAQKLSAMATLALPLAKAIASGELPRRLAHNDTKLSNILFAKESHEPLSIIDFDTVMPGSPLYDFGDLVRSAAATGAEDEPEGMEISLEKYEVICQGFIPPLLPILNEAEREYLPLAPLTITCELSLRFFADYLSGDHYFAIHYPEQNFKRGLAQLKLAESMAERAGEMAKIAKNNLSPQNLKKVY